MNNHIAQSDYGITQRLQDRKGNMTIKWDADKHGPRTRIKKIFQSLRPGYKGPSGVYRISVSKA